MLTEYSKSVKCIFGVDRLVWLSEVQVFEDLQSFTQAMTKFEEAKLWVVDLRLVPKFGATFKDVWLLSQTL